MSPVCVRSSSLGRLGQAEVGDPDVAVVVEQQVRRLDVAVQDPLAVGVVQGLGHLHADPGHAPAVAAVGVGQRRQLGRTGPGDGRRIGRGRSSGAIGVGPAPASPATGSVAVSLGAARRVGRELAGDQSDRATSAAVSPVGCARRPLRGLVPVRPGRARGLRPASGCRSRRSSSRTSSSPRPAMNCMT